jgi:hypothetical protein
VTFKEAVESTAETTDAWQPGLQALTRSDRQRVEVNNSRRLTGSVCLDTALQEDYPSDPRWDYGIGYKNNVESVYWVEIHPANEGAVETVLSKLAWLKKWLKERANDLDSLQKQFVWISSGKTSFTQSSPQAKRCASQGIKVAGRKLNIGR